MVCANCGSEIEQGVPCPKCGAAAAVIEQPSAFQAAAGMGAGGQTFSTAAVETPKRTFCTNCGATIEPGQPCTNCAVRQAAAATQQAVTTAISDVVGLRALGYIIDVIPMIIIGVVIGWIPIIGAIIFGVILLCYWLLRDFAGHSLGKIVLGLEVVKKDGTPSDTKARILRNVTIAIGPAFLILPVIGYVLGPVLSLICIVTEMIMLLVTKERIGDRLAGTTVVKKLR